MALSDLPLWLAARRLTPEQQRLVEANHKLARRLVAKLSSRQDVARLGDDALGWAFLGLCNAARSFQPERGLRFSTPAWTCIVREVLAAARREARHAAVPISALEGFDAAERPTIVATIEPDEWSTVMRAVRLAGRKRRRRKRKVAARRVVAVQEQVAELFQEAEQLVYRLDVWRRLTCGRRVPAGVQHQRPVYRRRVACGHRVLVRGRAA